MQDIKVEQMVTLAGGQAYECVYVTNPRRGLVKYDGGLIVAIERDLQGVWDLAAEPANAEESAFIKQHMPAEDSTEIDLVKDPTPESQS